MQYITSTVTQTVVRLEDRDGSVQDFILKDVCSLEHIGVDEHYFDGDFDFTELMFMHADGTSGCIGIHWNPEAH